MYNNVFEMRSNFDFNRNGDIKEKQLTRHFCDHKQKTSFVYSSEKVLLGHR